VHYQRISAEAEAHQATLREPEPQKQAQLSEARQPGQLFDLEQTNSSLCPLVLHSLTELEEADFSVGEFQSDD
jgi:hypothetical protein